jgi:hypothetical protein
MRLDGSLICLPFRHEFSVRRYQNSGIAWVILISFPCGLFCEAAGEPEQMQFLLGHVLDVWQNTGPDSRTLFNAGCDSVYTIQLKTPGISAPER